MSCAEWIEVTKKIVDFEQIQYKFLHVLTPPKLLFKVNNRNIRKGVKYVNN